MLGRNVIHGNHWEQRLRLASAPVGLWAERSAAGRRKALENNQIREQMEMVRQNQPARMQPIV